MLLCLITYSLYCIGTDVLGCGLTDSLGCLEHGYRFLHLRLCTPNLHRSSFLLDIENLIELKFQLNHEPICLIYSLGLGQYSYTQHLNSVSVLERWWMLYRS